MKIEIPVDRNRILLIVDLLLIFLALTFVLFSVYYLFHSRVQLSQFYMARNDCFYKSGNWSQVCFTDVVKQEGNKYCLFGLMLSISMGVFQSYQIQARLRLPVNLRPFYLSFTKEQIASWVALTCIGTALWYWGNHHFNPSFDEVFSAVNSAGQPKFQIITYYMLPNNHIAFNLLNHILGGNGADLVTSGRRLSLLAYIGTAMLCQSLLLEWFSQRILAFAATLTIMLLFPLWAFSFQARGYECYALCELAGFYTLYKYHEKRDALMLMAHGGIIAAGYYFIPTYSYIHFGFLLMAFWKQVGKRKLDTRYWGSQIYAVATVFLLYLPSLCYSGKDLVAGNTYVAAGGDLAYILKLCGPYVLEYASYIYSSIIAEFGVINNVLFLCPLLLLVFVRNKKLQTQGVNFVALWLGLYLLVIMMKKFPPMRSSIGHDILSLMFMLLLWYHIAGWLAQKLNVKLLQTLLFVAATLLLDYHFLFTNAATFNGRIYNYPINERFVNINNVATTLPAHAPIGLTDESFYWYYILQKTGKETHRCVNGDEPLIIKQEDELFPGHHADWYQLERKVDIYEIYKRMK